MVIFLITIGIIFIISLFFFILCISTLQVEVKNLIINSTNEKGKKIEDYTIYIRLRVLKSLTWFKVKLNKERIKRSKAINKKIAIKAKEIEKKLLNNRKRVLNKENIEFIKALHIKIDELNLYLKVGLIDSFLTSISVAFISILISILLAKTTDKYDNNKYLIMPEFNADSKIEIKLNCIINIKMIHIINVIYMLIKKKRSVEYDERTSNRRSYVCGND